MSSSPLLTVRETEAVTLLSAGLMPQQVADELEIVSTSRLFGHAKDKAQVKTLRSLVYVSLAREWIPRPAALTSLVGLDEVEACLWAGLRLDVQDGELTSVLERLARVSPQVVKDTLRALEAQHEVSRYGLITLGFAYGVLSGLEGHELPLRRPVRLPGQRRNAEKQALAAEAETPCATVSPFRPSSARSGPWGLIPRQRRAVELLAMTRTLEEAAAQFGVTPPSFRDYVNRIGRRRGLVSLRPLVHQALQGAEVAAPSPSSVRATDMPADVRAVWRQLVLDVPDCELVAEIAGVTNLPHAQVRAALEQLRDHFGSDWRSVYCGWACGAITAEDDIALPIRASRLTELRTRSARSRLQALRAQRSAAPSADVLRLVPEGLAWSAAGAAGEEEALAGGVIVTGQEADLIRIAPEACRRILAGTPADRWGPVLGHPEGRTALLLTQAGVLGSRWRTLHGRLWRAGTAFRLPPEGRPGSGGLYWAVPCQAPLWSAAYLERLLTHPAVPGAGMPQAVEC